MDTTIKDRFSELWNKYFNNAEIPITFYYTDEEIHFYGRKYGGELSYHKNMEDYPQKNRLTFNCCNQCQ